MESSQTQKIIAEIKAVSLNHKIESIIRPTCLKKSGISLLITFYSVVEDDFDYRKTYQCSYEGTFDYLTNTSLESTNPKCHWNMTKKNSDH